MTFVTLDNLSIRAARIVAVKLSGKNIIVYCDSKAEYFVPFRSCGEAEEEYEDLMEKLKKVEIRGWQNPLFVLLYNQKERKQNKKEITKMEMNYNMMDDNFAMEDFWMEYGGTAQEQESHLWEPEEF